MNIGRLSAMDFEPIVGTNVQVTVGENQHILRLTQVEALKYTTTNTEREPFRLKLLAEESGPTLSQGIHSIQFQGLEQMDLFLVPVATHSYEITFN